jgi:hypothetical protein
LDTPACLARAFIASVDRENNEPLPKTDVNFWQGSAPSNFILIFHHRRCPTDLKVALLPNEAVMSFFESFYVAKKECMY